MGYAVAWLVGPMLAQAERSLEQAFAIDLDPDATMIARDNFQRIGLAPGVECLCDDGMRALPELGGPIDLLYLDVDSAEQGKKLYRPLLELAYPMLSEGAWVLAHDTCLEQFEKDLAPYLSMVRDTAYFKQSVSLPFDFCGLEVSIR